MILGEFSVLCAFKEETGDTTGNDESKMGLPCSHQFF
jgi:hypothetical protein